MSQYVETPCRSFVAGAAIGKHLRVKLSSGKLAAAGIADQVEVGNLEEASFADGDIRSVRLVTAPGTCKMVAAAAIAAGALVYTAASGKVSVSASTARIIGVAMEAAGADGDIIEVMRTPLGVAAVA